MTVWHYLLDQYNKNEHLVGIPQKRGKRTYSLAPIFHKMQNFHVEVTIDSKGSFVQASVLDEGATIIPVTLESLLRTNSVAPHPIHDNLPYLSKSYLKHIEKPLTKDFNSYPAYIEKLDEWVSRAEDNTFLYALQTYIKTDSLLDDLIREGILFLDGENHLMDKFKGKEKPPIFDVATNPSKPNVRFRMIDDDGQIYRPWEDKELIQAHIEEQLKRYPIGFCYITGEEIPVTHMHPGGLRGGGDFAKMISTPTTSVVTFKGQYQEQSEVFQMGAEISLKIHNALAWLISKQGVKFGETTYLAFGTDDAEVITYDSDIDLLFAEDEEESKDISNAYISSRIAESMKGLKVNYANEGSKVVLIELESATPGRVAITNFDVVDSNEYLEKLERWQTKTSWPHWSNGKEYIGSPSAYLIAHLLSDSHLEKATDHKNFSNTMYRKYFEEVLDYIRLDKRIPRVMLRKAQMQTLKAQNKKERFDREGAIHIMCALANNYHNGELSVVVDENESDNAYLFGRLLALAKDTEGMLIKWSRRTNAEQYFQRYYQSPARTWAILEGRLEPYIKQNKENKGLELYLRKRLDEVKDRIDFTSTEPLNEMFFVGYDAQLRTIKQNTKNKTNKGEIQND